MTEQEKKKRIVRLRAEPKEIQSVPKKLGLKTRRFSKMCRILVRVLLALFCMGMGVAAFALILGQILVTRRYSVHTEYRDKVRVAAISDLHGKAGGYRRRQIVNKVRKEEPDVIVYLGDMADRNNASGDIETLLLLTKEMIEIAPVYYVDGNHEQDIRTRSPNLYAEMLEKMGALGAVHLENEIISLKVGVGVKDEGAREACVSDGMMEGVAGEACGSDVMTEGVAGEARDQDGMTDGVAGEACVSDGMKNEAAFAKYVDNKSGDREGVEDGRILDVNICGISTHYYWGEEEDGLLSELRMMDGAKVLICHYPESVIWYDAIEKGGLDVALCGHTHGGLVRIPFLGGMYAPEQGWWPKYDLGAYPVFRDTTKTLYGGSVDGAKYLGMLIISGGLSGEHGLPRINNPREVSIVDVGVEGAR